MSGGSATGCWIPRWRCWPPNSPFEECWICTHRGRGLGARLLETAIAAAANEGSPRLELVVYSDNAAAIGLYEKFVLARKGVFREQRDLDGVREDVIAMVKFLK